MVKPEQNGKTYILPAVISSTESMPDDDSSTGGNERGNWAGKLEFFFSCLSYAVGLGNLWRFPYLCYRNGGGAFLIPYASMLFVAGIPLFFMELSFGQFAAEGVISIWKISPLFQGIGWGMFVVSVLVGIYYNMIIAWSLFYLFASFGADVPWRSCDNHWNTPACSLMGKIEQKNCTKYEGVWYNRTCFTNSSVGPDMLEHYENLAKNVTEVKSRSPSDEYFHEYVLDLTEGFHDMGGVKWELVLCLLLAWMIVVACLSRGVKSFGKAVYFTALFPYAVLVVLLIRGLTLPGSVNGILFYLTPDWGRLLTAKVWADAAVQIFFSLSPCWGGLITLASYNNFNNNCLRDAFTVSLGNCLTSFFAGFVIFGVIGYMAYELGVEVGDVAASGAGLAFIVYPEVVTRLPVSPVWSILFFAMLISLGLGTQFTVLTTVHTTLMDTFPRLFRKGIRKFLLLVGIAIVCFILGLPCCSKGGMYVLQLMDTYVATYSVLVIGIVECLVLSYVYGGNRFLDDIKLMLGKHPGHFWKYIWGGLTPAVILFILIFTWVDFKRTEYGDYTFPTYADGMGWMLSMCSILPIPLVAIYKISQTRDRGTIWQTIKFLSKPTPEWGPADKEAAYGIQGALNSTTPLQGMIMEDKLYPNLNGESKI